MFALLFLALIGLFVLLFLWKLVSTLWILRYGDAAEKQTLEQKINPEFSLSPEMALRYRTKSSKLSAAELQTPYSPKVGQASAPIKMVAFIDFECPYTQSSYPALKQMLSENEGLIELSVRNFPLAPLHPNAYAVAVAATCAGEQKQFFAFSDLVFTTKKTDAESLFDFARQIGLRMDQFETCILTEKHSAEIQKDIKDGVDLGIRGTPTFIINDKKIEGTVDNETWKRIILDAIQQKK